MMNLFRNLIPSPQTRRPGFWLAGQFRGETHPLADNAIAAWSEFMGRESAELWIAAKNVKDTASAQRPALPQA